MHKPTPTELLTNKTPTPLQAELLDALTEQMIVLGDFLTDTLPESRYRSVAMTKLEECSMWAKKAAVFTVGTDATTRAEHR